MSLFVACWFAAIGAFRSSLLFQLLDVVPSQVRFVRVDRLLCLLIVGIQSSGILIPLFHNSNDPIVRQTNKRSSFLACLEWFLR